MRNLSTIIRLSLKSKMQQGFSAESVVMSDPEASSKLPEKKLRRAQGCGLAAASVTGRFKSFPVHTDGNFLTVARYAGRAEE